MRVISLLACCTIVASIFAGCGNNAATTQPSAGTPAAGPNSAIKIAVIPKGTTDEFWKSVHAGAAKAKQEAQAAGANVQIIWQGPVLENDSIKQIAVVENMMNSPGISAIVLAPNDSTALADVVDSAAKKNIPVIIIDSDIQTDNYKSFVATDNYKGGQLAGIAMATLLKNQGRVIVFRHDKGQASTEKREQGFIDALKPFSDIQIVSSDQYAGPTGDTAYKNAENLLAGFKNADNTLKADGIFASNESSTYGMLRALEDLKAAGKVKFIGIDASQALVSALGSDEINGLIVQDPVNMGYLGVKSALAVLTGQTVDRRIDTGVHLATKDNMNTPQIHDLLAPPLDKYLK